MAQLSRRRFAASLAGAAGAARLLAIPPRPKLFVLLLAEQFRSDYLSRFAGQFGPGGFRDVTLDSPQSQAALQMIVRTRLIDNVGD